MEFYQRTSQYTDAPAALLMALHARAPLNWSLTRENEFRIWLESVNLPTRSSSIYALANIARETGIPATVVVGEKEYDYPDYRFQRYKKIEIDDAKYASKLHAKHARDAGVKIEEREFPLTEVRDAVKDGKLVLLRVNAGIFRSRKATSKYVLVHGYDKNEYHVMDSEQGELHVKKDEMQEAFDTLVTKKKRDHRMIILG